LPNQAGTQSRSDLRGTPLPWRSGIGRRAFEQGRLMDACCGIGSLEMGGIVLATFIADFR
jgi:hypothetical protein